MTAARGIIVLLLVAAIALPFAPIAGPLSADDLFPLAAVMLALALIPFTRTRRVIDASVAGFLLLAALGLVSSAANAVSIADFARLSARSAGRTLFYLTLVVALRAVLGDRPARAHRALLLFALAATAEAAFCVWAFRNSYQGPFGIGVADVPRWSVLHGHTRVHGTFSGALKVHEQSNVSANFLASYLVLSVPATLGLALAARRWQVTLLLAVGALLQVTALYLTYTRAALVALGVAVLALGWLMGRRKLAVAMVCVAAVGTLAIPTMRNKFLKEGHNRYALWWSSIQTTKESPVVGVGDGNYVRVLSNNSHLHETPWGVSNTTAHNSLLLSAANHGVPGGLALALLYGLMLLSAYAWVDRSKGPGRLLAASITASLIGYLVQDQFNNLSYVPKVATQMWFLFALMPLAAQNRASTPEPSGRFS